MRANSDGQSTGGVNDQSSREEPAPCSSMVPTTSTTTIAPFYTSWQVASSVIGMVTSAVQSQIGLGGAVDAHNQQCAGVTDSAQKHEAADSTPILANGTSQSLLRQRLDTFGPQPDTNDMGYSGMTDGSMANGGVGDGGSAPATGPGFRS